MIEFKVCLFPSNVCISNQSAEQPIQAADELKENIVNIYVINQTNVSRNSLEKKNHVLMGLKLVTSYYVDS